MNALLVAGTDAGVGKTWVACALGRALSVARRRVVAIKPVETGCREGSGTPEDGVLLAEATGQTEPRAASLPPWPRRPKIRRSISTPWCSASRRSATAPNSS
jgi:dethiobiotin synthetase